MLFSFFPGFVYEKGDRCASFDGDADRIVYFYKDNNGKQSPVTIVLVKSYWAVYSMYVYEIEL